MLVLLLQLIVVAGVRVIGGVAFSSQFVAAGRHGMGQQGGEGEDGLYTLGCVRLQADDDDRVGSRCEVVAAELPSVNGVARAGQGVADVQRALVGR